ncbi:protein TIFY 6B-like isoform X3 [Carya illinoinensis]|uniref:protein TIFY 6B-like isoform X3 n=1 Tax=Carya illinoinensis TaxID=32201 RepID=UPI001C7240D7|nr:protein TIFY 6B-like isoform X3 [Carya illinoinensis]
MERDFLGLSSKNVSASHVKEEANDDSNNSVHMRGSGMQWSFSNKISAGPQFLSFGTSQEARPRKTQQESLASSGFMTISTADVFNINQQPYSGIIQEKYPQNQRNAVALGTTVLQSHHFPMGQNVVGSTIKPQPLRIVAPVSLLPSTDSIVGTTGLRNASKSSGAPAQLTIFYAGSVRVYDDITAEKAQAIMLLAGMGSSPSYHKTLSTAQEPSPHDGVIKNQSHTTPLFPGLPNPLSLSSQACSQSGVGASRTNELETVKPIEASSFPPNHLVTSKVVSWVECAGKTLIPTVGLPQARKASLARFLEKRKERVMHMLPYNISQKSPDCTARRPTAASPLTAMN